jgi:hypothetical protein
MVENTIHTKEANELTYLHTAAAFFFVEFVKKLSLRNFPVLRPD